jgi:hypothetical protein
MPQRFRIEQVFGLQSCISTVCGCILSCATCPRFSNPCTAITGVGQIVFAGIFDTCGCYACSSWCCCLMACCGCKVPLGSCWCGCYLIPAGYMINSGTTVVCNALTPCFAFTCQSIYAGCFCTCSFTFGNGIYMALGGIGCMPLGTVGATLFRRIS